MRTLSQLTTTESRHCLAEGSLRLRVGPYVYQLHSNVDTVHSGLRALYSDFPLAPPGDFVDFNVALKQRGIGQRLRRKAEFLFDQHSPFDSIPVQQSYAFLEWGMNWCVSLHVNEFLKLHAAVVAKRGVGVVMPGIPGAGKSTLCAALALNGWRVLSDEHALITPGTVSLAPLYRPVSLKNESISSIKSFSSEAEFGPVSFNTHKGEVAHLKADLAADSHDDQPVPARIMLFPQFSRDEPQQLSPRLRSASFVLAAYHSFNYSLLGLEGFEAMRHLVTNVECYDLVYHDLHWALKTMEDLVT